MSTEDRAARAISPDVKTDVVDKNAYVVGTTFNRSGSAAAIILGDGSIVIVENHGSQDLGETRNIALEDTPLCLSMDTDSEGFLVGTDAGALLAVSPKGAVAEIQRFPGKWITLVASHAGAVVRVASVGKEIYLVGDGGRREGTLSDHPSSVSGIAFSPDGDRLAVSHYDGVSIWDLRDTSAPLKHLKWKGSHIGLSWSPNGHFLVTCTQENELHCWNLAFSRDMRMSGYPSKVRSMSWCPDSTYLAVAGADVVTTWSFEGSGPEGKPPLEFGYVFEGIVTCVAAHPTQKSVAGGYSDGTVLIGDIASGDAIIAKAASGGAITAVAWSPDGTILCAGTEDGEIVWIRIVGTVSGRRDAAEQAFINIGAESAPPDDSLLITDCGSANCANE